jgi:phosphoglycerate dehydrogenase-like enzyme
VTERSGQASLTPDRYLTHIFESQGGTPMNIKKVGVVGCGLMGAGIAQVAAQVYE